MSDNLAEEWRRPQWSTDDCIDVTLIWLRQRREQLDDIIAKIEAVRPPTDTGSVT